MSEESVQKSPMALRIEERMEAVGYPTKGRLSTASGVSRAILTNIMRRPEKEIWASVAVRLAKYLKCRVEWLVDGNGPITDDIERITNMAYGCSPVVTLKELAVVKFRKMVEEKFEEDAATTLRCPVLGGKLTVAIKAERKLSKFDEDEYIYVDLGVTEPSQGKVVLARVKGSTSEPDFYTYNAAMDKAFLRSMNEDLPQELQLIEMTDRIEIIGVVIASAKVI